MVRSALSPSGFPCSSSWGSSLSLLPAAPVAPLLQVRASDDCTPREKCPGTSMASKMIILKPNVIPASRQLSFSRACEFQVFTPPKFCLSRRRCVAIPGVTRTPEIGARIQTRGCWAAVGVSLHLLFLCSDLPTRLLAAKKPKWTKTDQN